MRLHKNHGLNPTMTTCFYCGKDDKIMLIGDHVTSEMKAEGLASPDGKMKMNIGVVDMEPCRECAKWMKKGVILISVKDDSDTHNLYRTGGWAVIADDAINKMINDEKTKELVLKRRFCFVPNTAWEKLGLPKLPD
jgi:hypothetical protein